jgi:hypothetical protein
MQSIMDLVRGLKSRLTVLSAAAEFQFGFGAVTTALGYMFLFFSPG